MGLLKHKPDLVLPQDEQRILILSCCAPCTGGILTALVESGITCTLFFYNPNIQPQDEYERRCQEEKAMAKKLGLSFIDPGYDPEEWLKKVRGFEDEPERGRRCKICFDIRLEKAAQYAYDNRFKIFSSTLGFSRHKDFQMVNDCGLRAASRYPGLVYWTWNWRKNGLTPLSDKIVREEHFYRQSYCGCVFSREKAEAR